MKKLLSIAIGIAMAAWFVIGQPLVEWNDEIANLADRIHNIHENANDESDDLMAKPMRTSSDLVQASLRLRMGLRKMYKLDKQIADLYEHKPLGLPLTKGEQDDYEGIKRLIAKHEAPEDGNEEPAGSTTPVSATNIPSTPPPVAKSPKPTASPQPLPQYVTLTTQIELPINFQGKPSGHATLQRGTRLQLVSVSGDSVIIRYGDSTALIPLASTDFQLPKK